MKKDDIKAIAKEVAKMLADTPEATKEKYFRDKLGRLRPPRQYDSQFSFVISKKDLEKWLRICRDDLKVSGGEYLRNRIEEALKGAGVKK